MTDLKYIFIAALLVLASCQGEEYEEKNDANINVTFVARNEAKVKTTLNQDDSVLWEEEDKIKIIWEGGSVMAEACLGDDKSVAEFTATVPAGKDYYAVYPYSDEVSLTKDGVVVDIPQSQSGTFAGANITVAKADKQNNLEFKHVVGYTGLILCIPFIIMMAFVHSLPLMIVAILMFGFATGVYDSNIYAALFDVINPRFRAVATGLFGCGGCIVGALGPAVMGFLNDAFTPRVSMASLSIIAVVGALAILCARVFTFKKDRIDQ